MKTKDIFAASVLLALFSTFNFSTAFAQGTAFTYQGELTGASGGVTGVYDFQFAVFDSPDGGTQIGSTIVTNAVGVTNGLFTVTLDFGANIFTGNARWLDLAAHTNQSPDAFVSMTPRQQLTATPYAVYAGSTAGINGLTVRPASGNDASDLIAGAAGNTIDAGVRGAVIAGGGTTNYLLNTSLNHISADFSSISGGSGNTIQSLADHSVIAGGWNNIIFAGAENAFIGSGLFNTNKSPGGALVGGNNNAIQSFSTYSFLGGGTRNSILANANNAVIVGGAYNTVSGNTSFIGAGTSNAILQGTVGAFIGGGQFNTNNGGVYANIVGGEKNFVQLFADHAVIGGGFSNIVGSSYSTVGGGKGNTANGNYATVGGGINNGAIGSGATVNGGGGNMVNDINYATIGGGQGNLAAGYWTAIGGGANNQITTPDFGYSTIAGGLYNSMDEGDYGFIGGGQYNSLSTDYYGVIGGGAGNSINYLNFGYATIAGGQGNNIGGNGDNAFIGGGDGNTVNGYAASVPGGENNLAGGDYSFAAGQQAQATNDGSFVWADSQNAPFTSTNDDSFNVRAQGGVYFVTGGAGVTVDGVPLLGSSGSGIVIQQNSDGAPNIIEGSPGNFVSSGVEGATIGGGGTTNDFGLSFTNSVTADFGTVGGGADNTASVNDATVAGGVHNVAGGVGATVSGGLYNTANGYNATVGGGFANTASGNYSFAAGNQAWANNDGAFVWADSQNKPFASTANNEFSARATGGVRFVTAIDGSGNPTAGVSLASGSGSWSSLSDRNAKKDFAIINPQTVLAQVASLPLTTWSYKSESGVRHIGPMAQDFHAAFQVGEDERHITEIDESGVALAAIQGLNEKLNEKDAEIAELKARLDALEKMVRK